MKPILLDGSNVSRAGSGGGKLTSLATLAQMIHCLLANGFTPYTIFDASFRHRISESSIGQADFNNLTKQLPDYFQMSPAGEEADLFLLQLAHELQCPVVSNDTFKQYGKLKEGCLQYEGRDIRVCNYQMIAGVVVLPDLKICRRVGLDERDSSNIPSAYSSPPPESVSPPVPMVQNKHPKVNKSENIDQSQITDEDMRAVRRVINRFVNGGSVGGVQNLGQRLQVHRNKYLKSSGLTDKHNLTWFGFAKLNEFLNHHFPDLKVADRKIDPKN